MKWPAVLALASCLARPSPSQQQPDGQGPLRDGSGAPPSCESTTAVDLFVSGTCGDGEFTGDGSAMASGGTLELIGDSVPAECSWATYLGTGVAVSIAKLQFPSTVELDVATATHITKLFVQAGSASGPWAVQTWIDGTAPSTFESDVVPTGLRLDVVGSQLRSTFEAASGPQGGFSFDAGELTAKVEVALASTGQGASLVDLDQFVVCPGPD